MSQAEAGRFRYSFRKEPSELVLTVKRGADLAELIGICLGDGNLEPNTLAIFGDKSTDTAYLVDHVAPLMRRTLKLTARLKKNRPDENYLVLSSTAAVRALNQLGLPIGDKIRNDASIPRWILTRKKLLKLAFGDSSTRTAVSTDFVVGLPREEGNSQLRVWERLALDSRCL
jgi:hypothetical protein